MHDTFYGIRLPNLTVPWAYAGKHQLQPGRPLYAYDPDDPDIHPETRPVIGMKVLHFSSICAKLLRKQVTSMVLQLNTKLNEQTTVNVKTPTIIFLAPEPADMDKIDKAFCFLSDFDIQISESLAKMPAAFHNAKAPTMNAFTSDGTFWDKYTKHGGTVIVLRRQIYRLLNKQKKANGMTPPPPPSPPLHLLHLRLLLLLLLRKKSEKKFHSPA